MQSKSIITKTLNKMKPSNPNKIKIVSFNGHTNSENKSTTQSLLKAHALLSSKALPTITRILIEEGDNKKNTSIQEGQESQESIPIQESQESISFQEDNSIQENLPRRSRNKSSRKITLTQSEISFSKISLANNNEFLVSNSNNLFHPKEKVYMGQAYSANHAQSISEFAYSDNKRLSDSRHLKAIAVDNFEGNSEGLFCLFEGHDGAEAASYLQKNMRYSLCKAKQLTSDIDNAIKISFYNIDKEMKEMNIKSGSTGNIVYIRTENNKPVIYAANVGNSKTILISFNKTTELSFEHKVNNTSENKRLVSSGAMIVNDKLMGHYHLSRSFGDFQLKAFGVKCEPHIQRHVIEDRDYFIIIGSNSLCDLIGGNWSVIAEFHQSSSHILKNILRYPSVANSKESMSCFVLKLQ